jgi:5-(carboxyamino)imidazole ribonucleotide synthase
MSTVILPPAWLGVMGGGQLGRMFCHAAQTMGYKVCVLDPDPSSPCGAAADQHIQADYSDENALAQLATQCAAVTTEFENVPAQALKFLAQRTRVSPGADSVAIAQDRIVEKEFIRNAGAKVAPFLAVRSVQDIQGASSELFPGILKSARLGYDGKGQIRVSDAASAAAAFANLKGVPCVLEKLLPLVKEVSVVLGRSGDGSVVCLPTAENEHTGGILARTIVPARLDESLNSVIQSAAIQISKSLNYLGVLCVEFFIVASDNGLDWVVNEIAPRPHNSGHFSIEACVTSQFGLQVKAMAGLPLGSTRLLSDSVMINLLGDIWPSSGEPAWVNALVNPHCKLHLYGKTQARAGRKMGHITLVGAAREQLLEHASLIEAQLGIKAT